MKGIEGKLANRVGLWTNKVRCEKCRRVLPKPEDIVIGDKSNKPTKWFYCMSYLGTKHLVYENRDGTFSCYCSSYCAKKHNHRFHKK